MEKCSLLESKDPSEFKYPEPMEKAEGTGNTYKPGIVADTAELLRLASCQPRSR